MSCSQVKLIASLRIYDQELPKIIHECSITIENINPSTTHADLQEALRQEFGYCSNDHVMLATIPLSRTALKHTSLLMNEGLMLLISKGGCQQTAPTKNSQLTITRS